jgi:hypothetical protein
MPTYNTNWDKYIDRANIYKKSIKATVLGANKYIAKHPGKFDKSFNYSVLPTTSIMYHSNYWIQIV